MGAGPSGPKHLPLVGYRSACLVEVGPAHAATGLPLRLFIGSRLDGAAPLQHAELRIRLENAVPFDEELRMPSTAGWSPGAAKMPSTHASAEAPITTT